MSREDNALLDFCESYRAAAEVEFTIARLMCWTLVAGLAVIAAMLVLSLA